MKIFVPLNVSVNFTVGLTACSLRSDAVTGALSGSSIPASGLSSPLNGGCIGPIPLGISPPATSANAPPTSVTLALTLPGFSSSPTATVPAKPKPVQSSFLPTLILAFTPHF